MISYQLTYFSTIDTNGVLSYGETNVGKRAVAPVINLTPNYVNSMVGDGTMNNPYRAPGVTP